MNKQAQRTGDDGETMAVQNDEGVYSYSFFFKRHTSGHGSMTSERTKNERLSKKITKEMAIG